MDDQNPQNPQFSPVSSTPQPTTQIPQVNTPPSTQNKPQINNPYIIPTIINIVCGIIYSLLLVMNIVVLYRVIKFLDVTGPFGRHSLPMVIIPVVALALIVFANFGFVQFLNTKKKKGEIVNKVLLSSLVIAIPPIVLQITFYFLTMYSTFLLG